MKISLTTFSQREPSDLLIVPIWEGGIDPKGLNIHALLATGDFKGKLGETAVLYPEKEKEPRLLVLGLGKEEKGTLESIRRGFSAAARFAQAKKVKTANVMLPRSSRLSPSDVTAAAAEGLFLTNYAFTELKGASLKDSPVVLLERLSFLDIDKSDLLRIERAKTVASGVYFARDLVNRNADDKSPAVFAQIALDLGKKYPKIHTTVLDKEKLEKEKLGLILAVNRGSPQDPCLIVSSYTGNPGSKEHIVLLGKGIVFDTGGLNLKTGDGMQTMKCDLSGAATVQGNLQMAAALDLKVNVTAVTPVTENGIDGNSFKPGDVYRSHSGKTVEITSTDAEGRLVLADAMSYTLKHLKPTCMIDLASLTGAIVVALGEEISGLFTNDEHLYKDLMSASEKTGELLWRMPIHADYRDSIKSDFADMINTGGRDGGAIKAALFLQEFAGDVPWAHIDFAGCCFLSKPKHYNPTKGTGFGVRLLLDFLERRAAH